ncbi:syntaxin-12-like isoform X3 [Histomonas meleagridis]|uniref:syntaxin-12-like isoform X3 n=1 Tax=Histomonas meleagridis TaxID=135588 RepID=UPI003559FE53|nr:syntaxin-12-like isoform X3 [Histomonas meleagridis]KAH0806004.1 syntaxin-12-like isoform X3 [Histomonas meleagridis]
MAYLLANDIQTMQHQLDEICQNSLSIGDWSDTPELRESLQNDVKSLMELSQQVKSTIISLREKGDPEVDSYQQQFDQLRADMQDKLPGVLQALRRCYDSIHPQQQQPVLNQPLLDQEQLDGETEYLEIMEQEVNQILSTMRDLQQIFQQTLEEIQKQRHLLVSVDSIVTSSKQNMQSGNVQLEEAHKHQKGSSRAMCIIIVIIVVIAIGVVVFCSLYFTRK